ncbi:hemerythrin domain-containing protein [Dactylosporangium sp. NBC_01737]|uniref:hemerythrin domain-containing protein n=1 Tax=Dactylosporangium sp. NBC_01737 TaxID=2975959 RepID=UPI002E1610EA|nr:hemerythrin domain-containing protein [Dactylosporangium sp. NBC_01737]
MSAAPLPPLPPVPGIEDDDVDFGGYNMLDLLDEDHRQLASLCERLISPGEQEKAKPQDIEDVLVATLARHLSAEEQYLYPTVKAVLPDGAPIASQEVAADAELILALQRLHVTPAADASYQAALEAVTSHVRDHNHRTGEEVFPRLREQCTDTELVRLGNRVQIARGAAPTRPHPSTPSAPPLNKLVDPAVAVVDKVRDVLTRRTTWPEDLAS